MPSYSFIENTAELIVEATLDFVCYNPFWRSIEGAIVDSLNEWKPNFEFPATFEDGNTVNILNGSDFTKSTSMGILNGSGGTLSQNTTDGTLTITNSSTSENGLLTGYVQGGIKSNTQYTFSIDGHSSVSSLSLNVLNYDSNTPSEDGLSYGWNAVTKNEDFAARDLNGNYLGKTIPIGTKICILWCNTTKNLLQIEYLENGTTYTNCWITNDPNCLNYRYLNQFKNTSGANLQLYFGDNTPSGLLYPDEYATILYQYDNGKYCLLYNSTSPWSKTGTTTYDGSINYRCQKDIAFSLNTSGMDRGEVTFIADYTVDNAKISLTNKTNGSTMVLSNPKLELGEVHGTSWNPSIGDEPNQKTGVELGYKDLNKNLNIINNGDNSVGIDVTLAIAGNNVKNISLQNVTTGKTIKINGEFTKGNRIHLTTLFGNKECRVYTNENDTTGSYIQLTDDSNWDFMLECGDNVIKLDAEVGAEYIVAYIRHTEEFIEV